MPGKVSGPSSFESPAPRRREMHDCRERPSNRLFAVFNGRLFVRVVIKVRTSFAGIAQLVEQLICNQQVVGSNPSAGSSLLATASKRRGREHRLRLRSLSPLRNCLS